MPFYAYRDERYQAEVLAPRQGWGCDTSATAPLVLSGGRLVAGEDFERERQELLGQVPLMRRYASYMLKYSAWLVGSLALAATTQKAANVATSLSSFLTATKAEGAERIAALQRPVLDDFASRTAGDQRLASHHDNYLSWSKEMGYLAQR